MLSSPPVILSRRRRILVRAAAGEIGSKYRSAGRLPIGSPGSGECLFGLQRSTPPRHFVALSAPVGSTSLDFQVVSLPYKSSSFATPEGEVYSPLSFCTHKPLKA